MIALLRPWWREIVGRRAWVAAPIGALLAAVLALDPALAPEDGLGTYMAYTALLPIAVCFRLGSAVDRRRRDGLELEEALRARGESRVLPAGALAGVGALLAGLAIFAIPPLVLSFTIEETPAPALHPVRVSAIGETAWSFDAGGPLRPGTHLLLAFTWEREPVGAEWNSGARAWPLEAGRMLRIPLAPEDCRHGIFVGRLNWEAHDAGGRLIRPLVRLEVPRPRLAESAPLFAMQFLFAAPLVALVFLLARGFRVGGTLAALTATALAGLMVFDPVDPPRLGDGPADWIARAVLGLRDLLPDLRGLAPIGRGFELHLGTTPIWSAQLLWLCAGMLACQIAAIRMRRAP